MSDWAGTSHSLLGIEAGSRPYFSLPPLPFTTHDRDACKVITSEYQPHRASVYPGRDCIHFHAVETISRNERVARQFNRLWAQRGSATRIGGSPSLRALMRLGTALRVTSS